MFKQEVYVNRRKSLQTKLQNGIILILGNNDSSMNYPSNTYHFRQDSTFLYFFGIDLQGLAGIIDIDNDRHILFGDDYTLDDIIWMGPQSSMLEKASLTGVSEVLPYNELFKIIGEAVKQGRKIHFTPPYRGENIILISELTGISPNKVRESFSEDLVRACVEMRSIKEEVEIDEMERHMSVAYKMHTTAMKIARPGTTEQEITGIIEGISISGGGMVSFPVICSVRGETLHNHYHGNKLKRYDLLLVDAGSESPLHYATDHTRTTPVAKGFTQHQKEIYQIVLNANNAAINAAKPGVPYKEVHLLAASVIAEGLKSIGLMKGDIETAVNEGAHALFFPHGLGHMLGLDVHDMEDYSEKFVGYDNEIQRSTQFGLKSLRLGRRLQKGFVITVEPGIYFIPALIDAWLKEKKFENFINYKKVELFRDFGGIRLEDDILITESGARILGDRIPITIEEVEAIIGKK
ncbi:MAG: aminopeptidase P family protein [Marinilabiliaceae bacterium]|nr:aminopeptidase P family protein [Marinilabiliaceae bacterium]